MTNFFQNMASKFSKSKKEQNSLKNADDDPAAEQITPEELHQHFQNEEYFNQENVEETPDENVAKNVVTDEPEPLPVYEFEMPEKKSHWLRNTFLLLFFLIVIGAGAGYYYISNIDWNQHKDKIATEFMNFTGKKIVFEGPVHLTILPSPNLQAEKIKIYDPKQKKADPLAEIKSLVVDLTLPALLKGDFDVKMMSLLEPKSIWKSTRPAKSIGIRRCPTRNAKIWKIWKLRWIAWSLKMPRLIFLMKNTKSIKLLIISMRK